MTFDLARAQDIPQEILSVLTAHHDLLGKVKSLDKLLERQAILEIANNLNKLAEQAGIVGYHYTRSSRVSIEANGLITKSGTTRRREFLEEHGYRFTPQQREKIQTCWDAYFKENQNRARDNRIWFNLTSSALGTEGSARLLNNYGGEVVYKAFSRDCEIAKVLESIGEPMVIKCSLDTRELRASPWGEVWLSSYHRSVNPNACQTDFDVYTTRSVLPDQILSIEVTA